MRDFNPGEYFRNEEPQCEGERPLISQSPIMQRGAATDPSIESSFQRLSPIELVVFVGSPGCGKSHLLLASPEAMGYERVNQDTLKTVWDNSFMHSHGASADLCSESGVLDAAQQAVTAGQSVAIGM